MRMRTALLAVTGAVAAVAGVGGCASPEYRFVANPDNTVVMKVPRAWSTLDAKKVAPDSVGAQSVRWLAFYDGSERPKVANAKAALPASPLLVAESFALSPQDLSQVDDDVLRNIARPITREAQQQDAVERQAAGLPPLKVTVDLDEPVRTKQATGVHVVFSTGEGSEQVHYNQVGMVDRKGGFVHFLVIKCSEACYQSNRIDIETVAQSFTVKKKP
jgi:hypothetical protein